MSCETVQERISLLLDCKLPAIEREFVLAHLNTCDQCAERFETMPIDDSFQRPAAQL